MTIILFILIFGVIVLAHEFGHFLLAKAGGIRVNEFYIGMGPKLFKFKKGDTEYSLRLFPIGGACVFEGEDGLATEMEGGPVEGSFQSASVWRRISTVAAGPVFNFILAFAFGLIVVGFSGTDLPIIQNVMSGFPAEEAGMQAGDKITRMNGERIYVGREFNLNLMLREDASEPVTLEYERDGERHTVTLTPKYDEETGSYLMGFQGYQELVEPKGFQVFQYGYYEVRYSLKATIKSLQMLVGGKLTKDDLAGPVGIAMVIDDAKEQAEPYGAGVLVLTMVNLAMLLSVNLGVMNLLPLPALDGGRLVFLIIEAIRGKPIPPEKEGMVHFAGFVALMVLMVFVMFNDLQRLFVR